MILAGSCNKDADGTLYRPNSDDGKEIHFSVSELSKTFPDGERFGVMEISIVRPGTKGDHEIFLSQMGADEQVFTIPESVVIKDGEYMAVVPVIVDLTKCVKGASYGTNIYISGRDQATGNYGVKNDKYSDAIALSAEIEIGWEPLMRLDAETGEMVQQTATYNYAGYWKGRSTHLPVEIARTEGDQTIYRVSSWGTNNVTFTWVVNSDKTCIVPKQNTGIFNSSYGQYIMVSDYPTNGSSASYTYQSYPCTWDGERTYSFSLIYYREGSTGSFGKGVETIVFEDPADRIASVDITYEGVDSTSTGFIGAKLRLTPNGYTGKYDVDIFNGVDTSAEPVLSQTLFEESRVSWNLSKGPHAVRAIAFDTEGVPGDTTVLTFTFDPDSTFCVQVQDFTFITDDEEPTSSIRGKIQTKNLVRGYYSCMTEAGWTSTLKKQTKEEYLRTRTPMSDDFITKANSKSGRTIKYNGLSSNTVYILAMLLENEYGEAILVERSVKTASKSEDSGVDAFDKTATLDSFIGSYLMTCGVGSSKSSATEMTFRTDITKMNDNKVIISGLASPIAGFEPEAVAYFDSQRHCLVLDPQSVGKYDGCYAQLAMYTGSSYVYASGAFLLGIVDGKIAWVSSPDYTSYTFIGYTYMKFSSLPPSSATYMKEIVDTKVFINPSMEPLEKFEE